MLEAVIGEEQKGSAIYAFACIVGSAVNHDFSFCNVYGWIAVIRYKFLEFGSAVQLFWR